MASTDSIVTLKIDGVDEFIAQLELVFNATYELQIAQGWVEGPSKHLPCQCLRMVKYDQTGKTIETRLESVTCPRHTIWADPDPICMCKKYGTGFIHSYWHGCPIHGWPRPQNG